MSRFTAVKEIDGHSELKPLYDEIVEAGFSANNHPLNFFTDQSSRPDILQATWKLTKALLVEGLLPASVKEMIMIMVSKNNHCRYCEVTHGNSLQTLGVSQEEIDSCMLDPELKQIASPHRELLTFALQSAANPKSVTEDDVEALRKLGLSDQEIMETVMVAAYANFVNTWADAGQVDLDNIEH